MTVALGKQGVTNIRRISIWKSEKQIQTNSYILTFNQLHTPLEVKIDYYLEKVEMYVPILLRCFKWQKYGHHMKACRGQQTCAKCNEKDLDHMAENCLKEIRCSNCQQGHPAYARSCDIDKKKGNTWSKTLDECVPPESKENSRVLYGRKHASVAWRVDPINQENEYRALVEKKDPVRTKWLAKVSGSPEKKYTWPNFSNHKLNKKLKMKRNPMWDSLSNNTQYLPFKHKPLIKVQNLIQSIHQKLCKTD